MQKIETKRKSNIYYILLIFSIIFLIFTNSELMNKPKKIESMNITTISPEKIIKGNKFNLFGDKSVFIINGTGFLSDSKLYVNNTALETEYGNEGYMTAILPDEFYTKKRVLNIQLRSENSKDSINISNEIKIPVVELKELQDMVIKRVSPDTISKNQKFNIVNGQSALGINGRNFKSGCKIYANNIELNTTFGDETFITAIVPDEIYNKEGKIQIQVRYFDMENETNHVSNKMIIPVK